MLVRAVCYRATPLDTLVDKALAGATGGGVAGPTARRADSKRRGLYSGVAAGLRSGYECGCGGES